MARAASGRRTSRVRPGERRWPIRRHRLRMKCCNNAQPPPTTLDRNDIGPDSASEAGQLRARDEELERENRRLMGENIALRSQIKELKATGGNPMSVSEFQAAI